MDYRRENVELINAVMLKQNIRTKVELAKRLKSSKQSIAYWCAGKPIGDFFRYKLDRMVGKPNSDPNLEPPGQYKSKKIRLPIYRDVPEKGTEIPIDDMELPISMVGDLDGNSYVVKFPNQYVVVKPSKTHKKGEWVVTKIDNVYDVQKFDEISTKQKPEIKGVAVLVMKYT